MPWKIYFGPPSLALAALAALEEAEAEFEPVRLELEDGRLRDPEFLALNASGLVPVLVADGQVITESIAVLTYIANRRPDAGLLPLGNPTKLAQAYELLSWFVTNVHVAASQIFRAERLSDDLEVQAGLKRSGLARFKKALAELNRITSGTWLLGDDFSVADPLAFVAWRWAKHLDLDLSLYPAWTGLVTRVAVRPSVARAIALENGVVA